MKTIILLVLLCASCCWAFQPSITQTIFIQNALYPTNSNRQIDSIAVKYGVLRSSLKIVKIRAYYNTDETMRFKGLAKAIDDSVYDVHLDSNTYHWVVDDIVDSMTAWNAWGTRGYAALLDSVPLKVDMGTSGYQWSNDFADGDFARSLSDMLTVLCAPGMSDPANWHLGLFYSFSNPITLANYTPGQLLTEQHENRWGDKYWADKGGWVYAITNGDTTWADTTRIWLLFTRLSCLNFACEDDMLDNSVLADPLYTTGTWGGADAVIDGGCYMGTTTSLYNLWDGANAYPLAARTNSDSLRAEAISTFGFENIKHDCDTCDILLDSAIGVYATSPTTTDECAFYFSMGSNNNKSCSDKTNGGYGPTLASMLTFDFAPQSYVFTGQSYSGAQEKDTSLANRGGSPKQSYVVDFLRVGATYGSGTIPEPNGIDRGNKVEVIKAMRTANVPFAVAAYASQSVLGYLTNHWGNPIGVWKTDETDTNRYAPDTTTYPEIDTTHYPMRITGTFSGQCDERFAYTFIAPSDTTIDSLVMYYGDGLDTHRVAATVDSAQTITGILGTRHYSHGGFTFVDFIVHLSDLTYDTLRYTP